MTEFNTPLAPRTEEADVQREARHAVLRDLLGAYADRELPAETLSQLDAHLVGCAECRNDLTLQLRMRDRLAGEPSMPASPALRLRLAEALDAATPHVRDANGAGAPRLFTRGRLAAVAVAGWMLAALAAFAAVDARHGAEPAVSTRALALPVHDVPLLDEILANHARITTSDMPGRARDLSAVRAAVGFPVEPLHGPTVRLIGAWTTELKGEPAAVLAYRLDDRLVVQYQVAEDLFFRHPAIRAAVESQHLLTATDGATSMVAWPSAAAGSVLVSGVPTARLADIWKAERAR